VQQAIYSARAGDTVLVARGATSRTSGCAGEHVLASEFILAHDNALLPRTSRRLAAHHPDSGSGRPSTSSRIDDRDRRFHDHRRTGAVWYDNKDKIFFREAAASSWISRADVGTTSSRGNRADTARAGVLERRRRHRVRDDFEHNIIRNRGRYGAGVCLFHAGDPSQQQRHGERRR
jgi:hypothetical protein